MTSSPMPDWLTRHWRAWYDPQTAEERTIVTLANEMRALSIRNGEDGVLSLAVAHLGTAIRVLLDGEHGRLDAGTVMSAVSQYAERAGINPDNL